MADNDTIWSLWAHRASRLQSLSTYLVGQSWWLAARADILTVHAVLHRTQSSQQICVKVPTICAVFLRGVSLLLIEGGQTPLDSIPCQGVGVGDACKKLFLKATCVLLSRTMRIHCTVKPRHTEESWDQTLFTVQRCSRMGIAKVLIFKLSLQNGINSKTEIPI